MSWATAASIAEVISAVAVVVSLIYVAAQIRDNTKASKAQAFQATIDSEMSFAKTIVEHAATWDKVLTGAPLTPGEETREAIVLYNLFMLDAERRYVQYHAGYLEARGWQGSRKSLPNVVALPIFKLWRPTNGAMTRSEDFLKLVDELAQKVGGD